MENLFLKLLNMSMNAGWLILAVLGIRLVFRKIPKWMICLLWGLVAVRLICPFSVESRFSVLSGAEPVRTSTVVEGEIHNYIPSIDSRLTIVERTINPMLSETFAYDEAASVAPFQVVSYVAGIIWMCGMILLAVCAAGSMIRLHRSVREAVCEESNIYLCDRVNSPFILGIVRPRIYLSSALSRKEKEYIIAHETAHLKRKDHWWKLLGYLLLCVYWFHPLCWIAYAAFCRDTELACDEKAAGNMTFSEKKEYSKVLVSCAAQRRLCAVYPLAFGEVGVKERVRFVLNYKKPALWISLASSAVFVALAVCFLTNPSKEETGVGVVSWEGDSESGQPSGQVSGVEEPAALSDDSVGEVSGAEETVQDIMLYEQPVEGRICIEVQPSMLREYLSYYYVPADDDQEWLAKRIAALDLEGKPSDWNRFWEGHKETGWKIIYKDARIMGFEGGYLYYACEDDEKGMMECLIEDPKLCDYIQIMLIEKTGYQHYDVSRIKDIVSARLDVNSIFTGWKSYSQTVTDAETLQKFEEWFSNAEYIFGGADCGNQRACLELTLSNGDKVRLSMATDSCPDFSIDGVAYDYRPAADWDNREFFQCFNEIPWEWE